MICIRSLLLVVGVAVMTACPLCAADSNLESDGIPVIPWTRFSIQYTVRSIGNLGPQKVEFYITNDGGKTWTLYGEDPDRQSPMTVKVPGEGIFGFVTVGTDHNGHRERAPLPGTHPETVIIVDRTPPTVAWISPTNAQMLNPEGIELAWQSSDQFPAADPVTLQYSEEGSDKWITLKSGLPAKGKVLWKPAVTLSSQLVFRAIAKDQAGNKRIAKCTASLQLDSAAPEIALLGPTMSSRQETELRYRADDAPGGSGLDKVGLYYTYDNGLNWHYYGEDSDIESPLNFLAPRSGAVGLQLVARDKAGNVTPLPRNGMPPAFTLIVDSEGPAIHISQSFAGASNIVRVGSTVTIQWTTTDENIRQNSAQIEYSVDAGKNWLVIANNLPVNMPFEWSVPNLPGMLTSTECYLRVTASDLAGHVSSKLSQSFQIETDPAYSQFKPMGRKNIPEVEERPYQNGSEDTIHSTRYTARDTNSVVENVAPSSSNQPSSAGTESVINTSTDDLPAEPTEIAEHATESSRAAEVITASPSKTSKASELPSNLGDFVDPVLAGGDVPALPTTQPQPVETEAGTAPFAPNPGAVSPPPVSSMGQTPTEAITNNLARTDSALPSNINDLTTGADIDHSLASNNPETNTSMGNISTAEEVPVVDDSKPVPTEELITKAPDQPAVPSQPIGLPPAETATDKKPQPEQASEPILPDPNSSAGQYISKAQEAILNSQYDLAAQYCEAALKLDNNNAMAHAYYANVLVQTGDYAKSIEHARLAATFDPKELTYLRVLGESYLQYARSLRETLSSLPEEASSQRLELLNELNLTLNNAESTFTRIKNAAPNSKEAYEKLGNVAYFRARIAASPDQADAAYSQAIELYERSYSIGKGTYTETFQIGLCYYNRKDYVQAQHWLELAVENAGTESPKEAFFYLGKLHDEMERPTEALPYWIQASKAYPKGNKYRDYATQRAEAIKRELDQP